MPPKPRWQRIRRSVSPDEIAPYVSLFEQVRSREPDFESAIRETFAAVLVSPHFLYRVETRARADQAETVVGKLSGGQKARLSLLLATLLRS